MGLSEAWKLHEGGVRLYTGGCLVLGHYYRIDPEEVRVWGMESEFLRTRHISDSAVDYEEANGFFFFWVLETMLAFKALKGKHTPSIW